MKTNDKDIEKMAREYDQNKENVLISGWNESQKGYKAGFKACEAKMLAETSEGVERWQIENLSSDQSILIHDLTERAFTAGAMSQAKKDAERIKRLEKRLAIVREHLTGKMMEALKQGGEQ